MTKKDFEFIADMLGQALYDVSDSHVNSILARVAGSLGTQNPRFDSTRFILYAKERRDTLKRRLTLKTPSKE